MRRASRRRRRRPCSSNPSRPAPRRRTSVGQSCRTPCSLAVTANEFTVSFALPGYQPQTVPVRVVASASDGSIRRRTATPRLVPNPVFVELQPAAPPPVRKKPAPAKKEARAAPGADRHGARAARPRPRRRHGRRRPAADRRASRHTRHTAMRPPEGGRYRSAFLDTARAGSLKRKPSGA